MMASILERALRLHDRTSRDMISETSCRRRPVLGDQPASTSCSVRSPTILPSAGHDEAPDASLS